MSDIILSNEREYCLKQINSGQKYVRNWFSNMLPFDKPFVYQGIIYKCPENFYQAMKLSKHDIAGRSSIANMSPFIAKKEIRNKKTFPWRPDWTEKESLAVMEYILKYKFSEGTSWFQKLYLTKGHDIIEWNNWGDKFWGKDVYSQEGENNLGKILMKIRDNL